MKKNIKRLIAIGIVISLSIAGVYCEEAVETPIEEDTTEDIAVDENLYDEEVINEDEIIPEDIEEIEEISDIYILDEDTEPDAALEDEDLVGGADDGYVNDGTYPVKYEGVYTEDLYHQSDNNCRGHAMIECLQSNNLLKGYTKVILNHDFLVSLCNGFGDWWSSVNDKMNDDMGDMIRALINRTGQTSRSNDTADSHTNYNTLPQEDLLHVKTYLNLEGVITSPFKSPLNNESIDNIKELVIKYGAVSVGFNNYKEAFSEYLNGNTNKDPFNNRIDNTRSYNANIFTNTKEGHEVTIVAWDDTYSKDNFKEGYKPLANGAFLCKDTGRGCWLWISYENTDFSPSVCIAEVEDKELHPYVYY